MTDDEAQALHDLRKKIHGENHDSVSCWCCCLDCDFKVTENIIDMTGRWTSGLSGTDLLHAVNDARCGKTTYIETDGERVAVIAPAAGKEPSQ
jgi:hypothetical protein